MEDEAERAIVVQKEDSVELLLLSLDGVDSSSKAAFASEVMETEETPAVVEDYLRISSDELFFVEKVAFLFAACRCFFSTICFLCPNEDILVICPKFVFYRSRNAGSSCTF